jgi:HEAT repeat protein
MGFLRSLFGPPDIDKLKAKMDILGLVMATRNKDDEIKRKAKEALIDLKEAAAGHLLKMLRGKEEDRTSAASLLIDIAFVPKTPLDKLFLMLAKEDWEGLVTLGRDNVRALLQMFQTPTPDNSSAFAAAWVLEAFTPMEALEPLAVCLEEGELGIDSIANHSIIKYGRSGAARLCQSLNDPKVPHGKKIYATHALAMIGPIAVSFLKDVMATRVDDIAAFCAFALGATGDPGIVKAIKNKMREITNPELRGAFEMVADAWANPPDSLIHEINSNNSGMRIMAASSLGFLREQKAAQSFCMALAESNNDAFFAKARAILKIGERDAINALTEQIAESDPARQLIGILAISESKDPLIVGLLIPYQKNPNFMVRMAAGLKLVSFRLSAQQ